LTNIKINILKLFLSNWKKNLTAFHDCGINHTEVTGETLTERVGRRRGKFREIGTKLSGRRTVTHLNPGKIPPFDWCSRRDTEGDKFRACRGIISQVKRQEEDDVGQIVFLLFIFSGIEKYVWGYDLKLQEELNDGLIC
jgi:hypothetical protein